MSRLSSLFSATVRMLLGRIEAMIYSWTVSGDPKNPGIGAHVAAFPYLDVTKISIRQPCLNFAINSTKLRGVGVFSRTLSLENRPTPLEGRPTLFVSRPPKYSNITYYNNEQNSSKQYSRNSSSPLQVPCLLLVSCSPIMPTPATALRIIQLCEQSSTCMVQKSEELHESGASPYSDVPCAVVSLASTIVSRGQTELRPDCVRFSSC